MSVIRNPNLHIVFSITLAGIMGVSSISPVLPKISHVFDISTQQVTLLITVFTMPGIFLTPVFGVLADLYGRKRVLAPVLFLFGIAGTACYFATEFNTLLLYRFLQGVGAASLGAMNVTIISDLFTGNDRTTALGYNSAVLSFGATIYPAIGGLLAIIGWNYPFLLPVLAIPVGLLVIFKLETTAHNKDVRLKNYLNGLLSSIKSRKVQTMFLLSTSTFLLLYGPILTFLPFYMEHFFESDTLTIGIILACMSVGNFISGATLGRISGFFNVIELLLISYLLYATALVLIIIMPSAILLVIPSVIFGFALGINNPNIQILIAKSVRQERRAAVLSINGMVLRLGQTIGPLIMTTFFALAGYIGAYLLAASLSLGIFIFLKSRLR